MMIYLVLCVSCSQFETSDLAVVALHVELGELELDAISDLKVIVHVRLRAALFFSDQLEIHGLPSGLTTTHLSLLVAVGRRSLGDAT